MRYVVEVYRQHRMAMWKHYVVLFGGFYDPGLRSKLEIPHYRNVQHRVNEQRVSPTCLTANYLNDLWLFDTQEYKWRQIVFKEAERQPSYVCID